MTPSKFFPVRSATDYRLSTHGLIQALVAEGHIEPQLAEDFLIPARTSVHSAAHPLVTIATQRWSSRLTQKLIDMEWLGQWLASKVELEWMHIDPLKIDVASVAGLVSHAYAAVTPSCPWPWIGTVSRLPPPSPSFATGNRNWGAR